jgi:hypothetical protein
MADDEIELDLNPETVCRIIDKAHEFHAKEEVVLPDTPFAPGDTSPLQILADHQDDPTYAELKFIINDLEPDQQVSLVALMWLGRGDYGIEEWEDALRYARDAWNSRTDDYLIATPQVADYLEEGLALLGHSCE